MWSDSVVVLSHEGVRCFEHSLIDFFVRMLHPHKMQYHLFFNVVKCSLKKKVSRLCSDIKCFKMH